MLDIRTQPHGNPCGGCIRQKVLPPAHLDGAHAAEPFSRAIPLQKNKSLGFTPPEIRHSPPVADNTLVADKTPLKIAVIIKKLQELVTLHIIFGNKITHFSPYRLIFRKFFRQFNTTRLVCDKVSPSIPEVSETYSFS